MRTEALHRVLAPICGAAAIAIVAGCGPHRTTEHASAAATPAMNSAMNGSSTAGGSGGMTNPKSGPQATSGGWSIRMPWSHDPTSAPGTTSDARSGMTNDARSGMTSDARSGMTDARSGMTSGARSGMTGDAGASGMTSDAQRAGATASAPAGADPSVSSSPVVADAWVVKTDPSFQGVVFDVFVEGEQIGEYAAPNVSADVTPYLHHGRNMIRVKWSTPPGSGGSGTLTMGARRDGRWTTVSSLTGGRFQVPTGDATYQVIVP